MGKIAFLYPGEGAQKVGMGSELLESSPDVFARFLTRSDSEAGVPVTQYMLEGPYEVLSQAQIAQPAVFACSLALTEYAHRLGLYPDLVAGYGLGEYAAAVVSGALPFEDGVYLVCQRGKLMQQIEDQQPGAMAAVVGLPLEIVQNLCTAISSKHYVAVTGWNTPTQLVVSGVEAGVQALMEAVSVYTIAKVTRLPVKGAFHSDLMTPVQSALREIVWDMTWSNAYVPFVATVSGKALVDGQRICQALIDQVTHPIRWAACIETLLDAGCDTFVEIGPSHELTNLVHSIAPSKTALAADTPEKIEAVLKMLDVSAGV